MGGMSNRRGPTLAERSAAARSSTPTEATPESPADDSTAYVGSPRQRHCWVCTPDAPSEPLPGLVVEWRRPATEWEARVVYALDESDQSTIVEAWIPAHRPPDPPDSRERRTAVSVNIQPTCRVPCREFAAGTSPISSAPLRGAVRLRAGAARPSSPDQPGVRKQLRSKSGTVRQGSDGEERTWLTR